MRGLAMARYRLLTSIRSARWIFLVAFVAAAGPIAAVQDVFTPATAAWASLDMRLRAQCVTLVYMLHLAILFIAFDLFGTWRRTTGGDVPDLTETVPITPAARFAGDAAGIFACVLALHVCTLPLLALAVVLSPLPASVFLWLELLTLALTLFGSAAASWKLHGKGTAVRTRSARSGALFGLMVLGVLFVTTRLVAFRDAFVTLITDPSPYAWQPLMATVTNPSAMIASLLLLYFGFIGYYALQSMRAIEL